MKQVYDFEAVEGDDDGFYSRYFKFRNCTTREYSKVFDSADQYN